MVGEPIDLVQEGIAAIVKELRTDPYALETVFMSIIAFAGKAKKITSMVELFNFYPPKLPIGGGTSLGKALDFLADDIKENIKKTTLEEKGDWKPIIFLFTDGTPTDDYQAAFERWNKNNRHATSLVAISLGQNTDLSILGQLTENVLLLKDTDEESFRKFFKWVTASIKASSVSVMDSKGEELSLAPVTNGFLSKIDLEKNLQPVKVDENFVVILAKCQNTKRPYLIKYQKRLSAGQFEQLPSLNVLDYKLQGAYPIDNSYFEMQDEQYGRNTINTGSLVGFPTCPCCGNQYGFSHCSCGKIMCTGEEEVSTCPWCGMSSKFQLGDGHEDITRTRG